MSYFFGLPSPPSGSYNLEFDFEKKKKTTVVKKKKCTCGSDKTWKNNSVHTNWCDKSEPKRK